ncbi:DUF1176 domain-containing protein, partial [Azotobacter chroococcum]|uniref:DUF1176 domain-containing protein n=1 Tax=Azotobacter chroococcum TaxID=353 RepID=UPI001F614EF4
MPRLSPLILILLGSAAQAAPEPVPLYREIKDWVVACDNLRSCQAISAAAFGFSPLRLVVSRDAGPKAQPFQGVCVNSPDDQAGGQDDVGCDSGALREAGTGQRHGTAGA